MKQPSEFGIRLRQARMAKGLTPDELGRALGDKDGGNVRRWETTQNIRLPRTETILLMQRVLEVSVEWLATGVGTGPAERSQQAIEAQIAAILSRYNRKVTDAAPEPELMGYWELLTYGYELIISQYDTITACAYAMARISAGTPPRIQDTPRWRQGRVA